jgi:hypothetical protein
MSLVLLEEVQLLHHYMEVNDQCHSLALNPCTDPTVPVVGCAQVFT